MTFVRLAAATGATDPRLVAAQRAVRARRQVDGAPATGQRVVRQQTIGQQRAGTKQKLEGLGRPAAHRSCRQAHRRHRSPDTWGSRLPAAVSGTQHRRHALRPGSTVIVCPWKPTTPACENGTPHSTAPSLTRYLDDDVVGPIDDEVESARTDRRRLSAVKRSSCISTATSGYSAARRCAAAATFLLPRSAVPIDDLTVEVGEIDGIAVDQSHGPHASRPRGAGRPAHRARRHRRSIPGRGAAALGRGRAVGERFGRR